MSDQLTPEWIKQIKEADDAATAHAELRKHRRVAAEKTLAADGPEFWKQLVREFSNAVNAMSQINVRGTLSDIGGNGQGAYQIQLTAGFPNVRTIYTNVFYRGNTLDCYTPMGQLHSIALGVDDMGRIVGVGNDNRPVLAPQLAQVIIQPMLDFVRS